MGGNTLLSTPHSHLHSHSHSQNQQNYLLAPSSSSSSSTSDSSSSRGGQSCWVQRCSVNLDTEDTNRLLGVDLCCMPSPPLIPPPLPLAGWELELMLKEERKDERKGERKSKREGDSGGGLLLPHLYFIRDFHREAVATAHFQRDRSISSSSGEKERGSGVGREKPAGQKSLPPPTLPPPSPPSPLPPPALMTATSSSSSSSSSSIAVTVSRSVSAGNTGNVNTIIKQNSADIRSFFRPLSASLSSSSTSSSKSTSLTSSSSLSAAAAAASASETAILSSLPTTPHTGISSGNDNYPNQDNTNDHDFISSSNGNSDCNSKSRGSVDLNKANLSSDRAGTEDSYMQGNKTG